MNLDGVGIRARLPNGWEGSIRRRRRNAAGGAQPQPGGAQDLALTHLGTFALPPDRGDFGSGAVDAMLAGDAFVALLEYEPEAAGTALFATRGLPRELRRADFSTSALQRALPGQAGTQVFFHEAGRAFCLYVVLGAAGRAARTIPGVNQTLRAITIGRR